MCKENERMHAHYENELKKQQRQHEQEMREAAEEIRALRRILSELTQDTLKEVADVKKDAYREADRLLSEIEKLKMEAEQNRERARQQAKEKYEAQEELEKQKGEDNRLTRLLGQDETNSSFPASSNKYNPRKKKRIANNRHKTGNNPGAQPGHAHHGRTRHANADEVIVLSTEEFEGNAIYRRTGRYVVKQAAGVRPVPHVIEDKSPIYRNTRADGCIRRSPMVFMMMCSMMRR